MTLHQKHMLKQIIGMTLVIALTGATLGNRRRVGTRRPHLLADTGRKLGEVAQCGESCWRIKSLVVTIVALGIVLREFNHEPFPSVYAHWPWHGSANASTCVSAWDVAYYLVLSEQGYQHGSPSCAFYPFWPAMIHVISFLTLSRPLAAGLLLGNGMSLAAFWLFYRLVESHHGADIGRKALLLLLACPGALFFSFPYTESIYLTMAVAICLLLENRCYLWLCVPAFLMPLTKPIGVFIILPIGWHLWEQKLPLKYWLLPLAPLLGYATYFAVMCAQTGNVFQDLTQNDITRPRLPSKKCFFDVCNGYQ